MYVSLKISSLLIFLNNNIKMIKKTVQNAEKLYYNDLTSKQY